MWTDSSKCIQWHSIYFPIGHSVHPAEAVISIFPWTFWNNHFSKHFTQKVQHFCDALIKSFMNSIWNIFDASLKNLALAATLFLVAGKLIFWTLALFGPNFAQMTMAKATQFALEMAISMPEHLSWLAYCTKEVALRLSHLNGLRPHPNETSYEEPT